MQDLNSSVGSLRIEVSPKGKKQRLEKSNRGYAKMSCVTNSTYFNKLYLSLRQCLPSSRKFMTCPTPALYGRELFKVAYLILRSSSRSTTVISGCEGTPSLELPPRDRMAYLQT